MNKARRNKLNTLISTLESAASDIEALRDEEQEAFDNMPEGLQQSDRGQRMLEIICSLDEAFDSAENAKDAIDEAIDSAENAKDAIDDATN
jgi:hypothetical protein